ncbi:OmpA family protein [Marinimicrobium agarilyticum]|uniref:OmpA family protein n=1 Tax=Marinimicrobium agarilyticum TaxID=306546 RepID=UPI00041A8750|nr:OmpA family protein [Marinimicrobium agarilyticum]
MKILTTQPAKRRTLFMALAFSSLMITSCAVTPDSPQGATQVRSKLTALQSNPNLADRARVELREAEAAVRVAEQPLSGDDAALGEHRVYMADRKVAIAEAKATARYAEDQRAQLGEERNEARLEARTREVGRARDEADRARLSEEQSAEAASQQAAEYQRQIDALQAEVTDRGLVLTLGDVLFATGSAALQGNANRNLDELVAFLNQYPERRVQIEGHTDNVGSAEYNQALSLRRAEAVSQYLAQQGIVSQRLSAAGIGMGQPIANNDSEMGRQQNRRVEIIIENPS